MRLSRQKTSFVATKVCLSRQNCVCRDKYLLQQTRVCRDRHFFVSTKDVFCRDKTFVAAKIILVAAPANDRKQGHITIGVAKQSNNKNQDKTKKKKKNEHGKA